MENVATLSQRSNIIKPKLKAFGVHVGISSVIFLGALYFIIYEWYPFPHFQIDGGWEGIRIMMAVDMILGPLITLIIFNPNKSRKEIRFDIGIIGTVQVCALIWGFYAVYSQRPVVIVDWQGVFYSLTAESFYDQGIEISELRKLSTKEPAIVYAEPPQSTKEVIDSLLLGMNNNLNEMEQFQLYRPFANYMQQSFENSLDIKQLVAVNGELNNELTLFLKEHDAEIDSFIYKQIQGRYKKAILIFSHEGEIAGILYTPLFVN